jgi:serine/threonine protein kinase
MTQTKDKVRCLSRYELLRQLGQGNLTRTFLAARRSPGSAHLVRLELLHKELAKDENFRALFLDRAARSLALSHPVLARTEEVVADAEACGVSLEFLDGQPLSRVLERVGRHRFPVDLLLHVIDQVLAGLEHAHDAQSHGGFVHRDVCPSNVFITYDGRIKLLATGFADTNHTLETRLGEPLADIRYAAPEVLLGGRGEPSADLFSVGVLLWEAITQRALVKVSDRRLIIDRRTLGREPALESVWPEAPESLIALCGRALAREPHARHANAGQLRAALQAYLGRATQASETVLARLPALVQSAFASEQEEMRLFIGASLESLHERSSSLARSGAVLDAGPPESAGEAAAEATPHDAEWSAKTSTAVPDAPAGGLGRELAERAAARTEPPPRAEGPPAANPAGTSSGAPAPASERRDSDTGGHRAYSATLPSGPGPSVPRPGPRGGTLAVAVLLATSLGASAAALSRHSGSSGARTPGQAPFAAGTSAAPVASGASSTALQPAAGSVGRRTDAAGGDAGAPAHPTAPAFFDGRPSAGRPDDPLRTLSLDDLPTVDDARDSLQQAVLNAARARRLALRRKRLSRPSPEPAREREREPELTRGIDETDPYAEEIRP